MSDQSAQLRLLLTGPALCGLLLAGMTLDNRQYRSERDFADFHSRAAAAIAGIPLTIGPWVGRERTLSSVEIGVLQPNAYRCVDFTDAGNPTRRARLVVTQCRRAGLMDGHYPPKCYPAQGFELIGNGDRRAWRAGNRTIDGTQYFFDCAVDGRVGRTAVYNFMVLPEQGVRPDMESVGASAEDYQQRYYGAAQFQLVFGGEMAAATPDARRQRDAAFAELIGPCAGVIATLCDGVNAHE